MDLANASMSKLAFGLMLLVSAPAGATPPTQPTGIGVWYAPGAPADTALWRPGDTGERLNLRVSVLDTAGQPVVNAVVELWHADGTGMVHPNRFRSRMPTGDDGSFQVSTVLPGYIWGPRHIHFVVTHPNHRRLVTRIFFKRDPVVAESGHPDLAIFLEDGLVDGAPVLFGHVQLVLENT